MNKNDNLIIPLKLKRLRETKFTEKKNPYKKYNKAGWNWIDIFLEIESLKEQPKIIKLISTKYNINYGTLKNKYSKFKNSEEFINIDDENRGIDKIFTEQQEREIFLFLKNNFIDKHKVLCNDIIKLHAQNKLKNIPLLKNFNASDGWCNDFKKRWNLSTVKISISKIASVTYTKEEINEFLNKCKNTVVKVGQNFFSI